MEAFFVELMLHMILRKSNISCNGFLCKAAWVASLPEPFFELEPMALCFSHDGPFLGWIYNNCFPQKLLEFAVIKGPISPAEKTLCSFLKGNLKCYLSCFLPPPPSLKEPIAFSHPSFDI